MNTLPRHTRIDNFGTVYLGKDGHIHSMDARDILCGLIAKLDERNEVLTTSAERAEFLLESYVSDILGIEVRNPFDLVRTNDVEGLYFNTKEYQLMQQYTIYPIYDLFKLNWTEFFSQSFVTMEHQLKMAKEYQMELERLKNLSLHGSGEEEVMMDESHKATVATNNPSFKRAF